MTRLYICFSDILSLCHFSHTHSHKPRCHSSPHLFLPSMFFSPFLTLLFFPLPSHSLSLFPTVPGPNDGDDMEMIKYPPQDSESFVAGIPPYSIPVSPLIPMHHHYALVSCWMGTRYTCTHCNQRDNMAPVPATPRVCAFSGWLLTK